MLVYDAKKNVVMVVVLLVALAGSAIAGGQPEPEPGEYPTRTITLKHPWAPGGGTDITCRALVSVFPEYTGQSGVVDSTAGGGGTIGMAEAAQAEPNGYTLTIIQIGPNALQPHLRDVPYDYNSFDYIGLYTQTPLILSVHPDAPYDSLDEFVEYARNNPGEIAFGHGATGGMEHLAMEMLGREAGIEMESVTFEGGGPATTAVVGGHIEARAGQPADSLNHIEAGDLKPLAVFTEDRFDALPDVPTAKEQGYDVTASLWIGLGMPAGSPDYALHFWRETLPEILEDDAFVKMMENAKTPISYMNHEEFREFVVDEYEKLGELLRELGMAE